MDTVRRCRRCGAPAVIVVNRWEAHLFGVLPMHHAGRTDHRCQSCGAGFTLYPWLLPWFLLGTLFGVQFGGMGVVTVVGSFIALLVQGAPEAIVLLVVGSASLAAALASLWWLAGPQVHAWRNPVVPGAQMPELRLGPPQDHRSCTCGCSAPCVRQRAAMLNRLPAGTEGTYRRLRHPHVSARREAPGA